MTKTLFNKALFLFIFLCILFWIPGYSTANSEITFDIVIENGRVIDPETKLDQVGINLGIIDNKIVHLSREPLIGKRVIDATGLVVSPGFIDPLSYTPNPVGVWYKLADGVTTNLALHGGSANPEVYFKNLAKLDLPLNYGTSFFVAEERVGMGIDRYRPASTEQIRKMVEEAERALKQGAMGVSFSLEYYPGTGPEEIISLMEVANKYNVPTFFHVRYSTMYGPGGNNIDALEEVLDYARQTGSALHIDHINSTGGTFSMGESLQLLRTARQEGLIVTACMYPYTFWGTRLSSARFDEGWQERFQIDYDDLQLIGHPERLNAKTFKKYRNIYGVLAVAYAMPAEEVEMALKEDFVMIGSDGMIEPGPEGSPPGMNNHPRGAGNFSRVIAKYAREKGSITLMQAIRKMTLLPAKLVEKQVPAMRKKGRIQEGMDADLVIFDYEKISDRSTVISPAQFSAGINYVLVNGQVVIDQDGIHREVRAGKEIRAEFKKLQPLTSKIKLFDKLVPAYQLEDRTFIDVSWLISYGFNFKVDGFKGRKLILQLDNINMENTQDSFPPAKETLKAIIARRELHHLLLPNGISCEIFYDQGHYFLPLEELYGFLIKECLADR